MALFNKKIWKNRQTEYPNRRILTKENGNTELVTVARSEGMISQEGDAFSAENMNYLETRIQNAIGAGEIPTGLGKDILEALDCLDKQGKWKIITKGSITGAGEEKGIDVPKQATEICIKVNLAHDITGTIYLPAPFLQATSQHFRTGYFQNGNNGGMASFACSTEKIYLENAFLNSFSVNDTTQWVVYCKEGYKEAASE